MSKSILIAGKDFPDGGDFAEGAETKMRNVAITQSPLLRGAVPANLKAFSWLRTSPVSARTLVLDCETAFKNLDEAVLYFDESYYVAKFNSFTTPECSAAVDEMVLGFQYLTLEILSRFEKISSLNLRQENAPVPKLVFLVKNSVAEADVARKAALRSLVPMASGPFVAAARAAFEAFAENTAALYSERAYVNVILSRTDLGNEVAKTDRSLSEWLFTYLDAFDLLKKIPSAKQMMSWVNAGAKAQGFSIFK